MSLYDALIIHEFMCKYLDPTIVVNCKETTNFQHSSESNMHANVQKFASHTVKFILWSGPACNGLLKTRTNLLCSLQIKNVLLHMPVLRFKLTIDLVEDKFSNMTTWYFGKHISRITSSPMLIIHWEFVAELLTADAAHKGLGIAMHLSSCRLRLAAR